MTMAGEAEVFSETTGSLARDTGTHADSVRAYADLGLLEHIRLPSGLRLFKPSAAEDVRKIRAERLKRRGGNHHRIGVP